MQSTLQPRLIQRFVSYSNIARDIEQETFLRVYQHIARFDPSRRLGPCLTRIGQPGKNLTVQFNSMTRTIRDQGIAFFKDNWLLRKIIPP